MITPPARAAAAGALPAACLLRYGDLGRSDTRKVLRFQPPDMVSYPLGLLRLGRGRGRALLLRQLAGMHPQKPERLLGHPPVCRFDINSALHPLPPPAPWLVTLAAAGVVAHQRQWHGPLPPGLPLLAPCPGAGHQGH
jgi:hypothetical protein